MTTPTHERKYWVARQPEGKHRAGHAAVWVSLGGGDRVWVWLEAAHSYYPLSSAPDKDWDWFVGICQVGQDEFDLLVAENRAREALGGGGAT